MFHWTTTQAIKDMPIRFLLAISTMLGSLGGSIFFIAGA